MPIAVENRTIPAESVHSWPYDRSSLSGRLSLITYPFASTSYPNKYFLIPILQVGRVIPASTSMIILITCIGNDIHVTTLIDLVPYINPKKRMMYVIVVVIAMLQENSTLKSYEPL